MFFLQDLAVLSSLWPCLRPEKIRSLSGQLFVHWRSIFYSHRAGIFAGKDADGKSDPKYILTNGGLM